MDAKDEGKDDAFDAKGCKADGKAEREDGDLVEAVCEYYASSPRLDAALRDFVFDAARAAPPVARGDEYAHEHAALHERYVALVDAQLEVFLSSRGATAAAFRAAVSADELGGEAAAAFLVAAASFDTFADLLADAQRGAWAGAGCVTYA